MPGAIKETRRVQLSTGQMTSLYLWSWQPGGGDKENQQTGTGLGSKRGSQGRALRGGHIFESSVMGRYEPLQDLGEEALNNAVRGGANIISITFPRVAIVPK